MLQTGKNIISANDPLRSITIKDLFRLITEPSDELKSKINQLRILSTIDREKYQQYKKTLPYFTCGIFSPPYRRTQNFGSIMHFIVDIDHLTRKEINKDILKSRLIQDERVELIFLSPGNDGMKVMFKLSEKCYDPAKYSLFYKLFAARFSEEYGLCQVIDKVTCDVARACFLSVDHHAFYNPDPLTINISSYINFDNEYEVLQAKNSFKDQTGQSIIQEIPEEKETNKDLSTDILFEIKRKLNPNIKLSPQKQLFVPKEIDKILPEVQKKVYEHNILFKSAEPINFGKKLIFELGNRWAQLNIFYGKQGYKVVKTPKTGSDPELGEVIFRILCEMFY